MLGGWEFFLGGRVQWHYITPHYTRQPPLHFATTETSHAVNYILIPRLLLGQ